MVYYFSYGSNMDEEYLKLLGVSFKDKFPGVLKGFKLVFNKRTSENFSMGNLLSDPNSEVEGIIYIIDLNNLKKLDNFEPGYFREKKIVVDRNGKNFKSYVYIANSCNLAEGLKPTKDYMRKLLNEKEFLSKKYYDHLLEYYNSLV